MGLGRGGRGGGRCCGGERMLGVGVGNLVDGR